MVPAGMSCLGLEYFCFEGDSLWNSEDADLIKLAKKEIAKSALSRRMMLSTRASFVSTRPTPCTMQTIGTTSR